MTSDVTSDPAAALPPGAIILSNDTLPTIFEAVPGKPYWRGGEVTGYRVFTGRPGRRDAIALFGDAIVQRGRYWDVIPTGGPR